MFWDDHGTMKTFAYTDSELHIYFDVVILAETKRLEHFELQGALSGGIEIIVDNELHSPTRLHYLTPEI